MRWAKWFLIILAVGAIAFCAYAFLAQGSKLAGVIGAGIASLLGINPVKKIKRRAKRETKEILDTGGIDSVRDDNDDRLRKGR